MSAVTSDASRSKADPPNKPLKLMSQQEKLAWKAAQERKEAAIKYTASSKSSSSSSTTKKSDNDPKKKNQHLRPSTPPSQTGSNRSDDGGNSPASQACTSGTVTPNSEGVKRADRKIMHAPPGGLDL